MPSMKHSEGGANKRESWRSGGHASHGRQGNVAAICATLLLSLSVFTAAQEPGRCSRATSREVFHTLKQLPLGPFPAVATQHVYPRVEMAGLQLPHECRLHPDHDMYRDQENNKTMLRKFNWKCNYCGKVFREEVFLDKHFDNRHPDKMQGHVCFADYEKALHTNEVRYAELNRAPKEMMEACVPSVLRERSLLCQNLFNKCFPPSLGEAGARVHDFFHHTLCDAHTCNTKKKRELIRKVVKRAGAYSWGYAILSGFLVVAVAIMYGSLLVYRVAKGAWANTPDLKRRPGRQRQGPRWNFNSMLRAVGAKQKTY